MLPFHREFVMGRGRFDPQDFGVNIKRDTFMDQMVEESASRYPDSMTIDKLWLHQREARAFCDGVRQKHGYFYVPDDIVLRSVVTRRKNP